MHTARFWYPMNGDYVKLTVRTERHLNHETGGGTDEGYHYTQRRFTYSNGVVRVESDINSSDCDGRLDFHIVQKANIDSVHNSSIRDVNLPLLRWERVQYSQRDYRAEAAGY